MGWPVQAVVTEDLVVSAVAGAAVSGVAGAEG